MLGVEAVATAVRAKRPQRHCRTSSAYAPSSRAIASERLFGARAAEIHPYLASVLELAPEGGTGDRLAQLSPEALPSSPR
ncbi:MAG TPA: hypothetical protein VGI72_02865 [Gaiellales bacterium]